MTRPITVAAGSALFGVLLAAGVQKLIWNSIGWTTLLGVGFMVAMPIYLTIRKRQDTSGS